MRRALLTAERRINRWAAERRRLLLLRVTDHYLVALGHGGMEAWFERSSGEGGKAGRGGAGGGHAHPCGDWRGWRLSRRDLDRYWADTADVDDQEEE
jgi:hypothetical protein